MRFLIALVSLMLLLALMPLAFGLMVVGFAIESIEEHLYNVIDDIREWNNDSDGT